MSEPSADLIMHRNAMKLARRAETKLLTGLENEAKELYLLAFEMERSVAFSMLDLDSHEPTRSVLFRSAASLGMLAGEYNEAKKLVEHGLAGNSPPMIANQLSSLSKNIENFIRAAEKAAY